MSERKVCVITGSSSGIGAASAVLFARRGWNVCVNFSRNQEPADKVAELCRAAGADALVVKADVAQNKDCEALAGEVRAHFARCDALINNAGTTKFVALKDLAGLTAEDFQRIYAVNVIGAFQMSRALVPLLKENPGSAIVNVSSIASKNAIGSSIAYMASKGALNSMTTALAKSLGPHIRVNAVLPGMVDSPWLRNGLGAERYAAAQQNYEANSTLAALVTPEEVAEAIFYLAASATKTTGEFQLIDGGRHLGR
jgi:NAD(P)-dependent dehydrogenase (short-subunit alcohol dehydrogenase family)